MAGSSDGGLWRRVFLVLACAGLLGLLLGVAGGPADGDSLAAFNTSPEPADGEPRALTAVDEPGAVALAVAEGRPVEVLTERSESVSVFALPDGNFAMGLSAGPTRARVGGDGTREQDWAPIDLTLSRGADGSIRPVAHPAGLVLSGGGAGREALASMVYDGVVFGFSWNGQLAEPRLEGNRATYESVRPGVDMVIEATADGFEQFFIIRERPRGPLVLPVDVWAEGAEVRPNADGGIDAVDAAGEVLATVPTPLMWDVAADEQRGRPVTQPWVELEGDGPMVPTVPEWLVWEARGLPVLGQEGFTDQQPEEPAAGLGAASHTEAAGPGPVVGPVRGRPDTAEVARTTARVSPGRIRMDLAPQRGFLEDPETEFPVVVDPYYSIEFGVAFDTSVQSGVTYDLSGDSELYLGSWNGGATKTRSFIRFNTASLRYKHIFESRLYLVNHWSYSCNARAWEIWHTDAASTSTRWTGQPVWHEKLATINSAAGFSSSCPGAWVNGTVTSLVQARADAGSQVASFGIKASNESDSYAWKRFWSANYSGASARPFLWVVYGSYPNVPTALTLTPSSVAGGVTYTESLTPTLSAAVSDPDGGTLTAVFEVRGGGAQVVTGQVTATSGTTASWVVPEGKLVAGLPYSFRVLVVDDYGVEAKDWSTEKTFMVGTPLGASTSARTTSPPSQCVVGAARPVINSATPTLRAVVSDPDPGNLRAEFSLYDTATQSLVWDPAPTTARAAGSEHTVTVPPSLLADQATYEWRVNGLDPDGLAGPVTSCEFTVDLQAPAEPGVAAATGQPAVYLEDLVAGGVGLSGQFEFSEAGSTDVVAYQYSFGDDSFGSSAPAATPVAQFTPTRAGPHVLSVRSVDAAGWVSPVRVYRFTVAES